MRRREFLLGAAALVLSGCKEFPNTQVSSPTPAPDLYPTVSPQELALRKQQDFQKLKNTLAGVLDPMTNSDFWTSLNATTPSELDERFSTFTYARPMPGYDLLVARIPYDNKKTLVQVKEWFDGSEVVTFYTDKDGNLREDIQDELIPLNKMQEIAKGRLRFYPDEWVLSNTQAPTGYSAGREIPMSSDQGTVNVDGRYKTVELLPNGTITIFTHPQRSR